MTITHAQRSAAAVEAAAPLKIRGRFLTAVVLPVAGRTDAAFYASLDALLARSAQFLANAPVVLDLGQAEGLERRDDVLDLLGRLRDRGVAPIGIQNASERQGAAAAGAGLPTLEGGREAELTRRARPAAAEPAPAPARGGTVLVTQPVRSGQQIVAEGGDIVVAASVGSGAELIADGNIHVYGSLRGRALAGVRGDTSARIFCQSLEAELVAIAGLYKTSEDLGPAVHRQRVQAFLVDDAMCIEPIK